MLCGRAERRELDANHQLIHHTHHFVWYCADLAVFGLNALWQSQWIAAGAFGPYQLTDQEIL